MGSRYFSSIQYGKEATRGTAVAATKIWLGKVPAINSDRKPIIPNEDVGIRAKGVRSIIDQYMYSNTLSTERGYFQQLPMLFGCGTRSLQALFMSTLPLSASESLPFLTWSAPNARSTVALISPYVLPNNFTMILLTYPFLLIHVLLLLTLNCQHNRVICLQDLKF